MSVTGVVGDHGPHWLFVAVLLVPFYSLASSGIFSHLSFLLLLELRSDFFFLNIWPINHVYRVLNLLIVFLFDLALQFQQTTHSV